MKKLLELTQEAGFANAAIISVQDFKIVPEYLQYCEENLCGNYNKNPNCPPKCGTVEELSRRIQEYQHALVMQTSWKAGMDEESKEFKNMKLQHNQMSEYVIKNSGMDGVLMSAGPYKTSSCLSAYCVDAAELAKTCNMQYWKEGEVSFYSIYLFH